MMRDLHFSISDDGLVFSFHSLQAKVFNGQKAMYCVNCYCNSDFEFSLYISLFGDVS